MGAGVSAACNCASPFAALQAVPCSPLAAPLVGQAFAFAFVVQCPSDFVLKKRLLLKKTQVVAAWRRPCIVSPPGGSVGCLSVFTASLSLRAGRSRIWKGTDVDPFSSLANGSVVKFAKLSQLKINMQYIICKCLTVQ